MGLNKTKIFNEGNTRGEVTLDYMKGTRRRPDNKQVYRNNINGDLYKKFKAMGIDINE